MTEFKNHEIVRCYGLCEYWYGNREKGIGFLEEAFESNKHDAEIVYNLIELYLLEYRYTKAKKMLEYYHKHHNDFETYEKPMKYYDDKISLFDHFVKGYVEKHASLRTKVVKKAETVSRHIMT